MAKSLLIAEQEETAVAKHKETQDEILLSSYEKKIKTVSGEGAVSEKRSGKRETRRWIADIPEWNGPGYKD